MMTPTMRRLLFISAITLCLSLLCPLIGNTQSDSSEAAIKDSLLRELGLDQPIEVFVSQKYDSLTIDTTHDPWMIAYFSASFDTLLTSCERINGRILTLDTVSISWLRVEDIGSTDEIVVLKAIRYVTKEWAEAHGITTFVADSIAKAEEARAEPVCVWISVYNDDWSEVAALGVNVKPAAFGALGTEVPDSLVAVIARLMTVRNVHRCQGEIRLN